MRSVVNTPEGTTPVEIRTVDAPIPQPDELIIDVKAFSINQGELRLMQRRPEGWHPGQDIAGVVVRAAEDGEGPPVGTRIVGLVEGMGWSEQAAVSIHKLALLPDNVSFEQAATLPIAGITALRTLQMGGSVLGKDVLITGATGGVGHFAVQLAALSGAYVTAVTSKTEQTDLLKNWGAVEMVTDIRDTGRGPFSLVPESVGGDSLSAAFEHVVAGGKIVLFGNSTREDTPISFNRFVGRHGITIESYISYQSGPPESYGQDLALMVRLISEEKMTPYIGYKDTWETIPQAAQQLQDRAFIGKAAFTIP